MKKPGPHLMSLKNYGNAETMSSKINWNQIKENIKKGPLILHVLFIICGISLLLMVLTEFCGLKLPDLLANNLDLIYLTTFMVWCVGYAIWDSKQKK